MMARVAKAYESAGSPQINRIIMFVLYTVVVIVVTATIARRASTIDIETPDITSSDSGVVVQKPFSSINSGSSSSSSSSGASGKKITLLTWNVAAINNNPFEYWITNDDPVYNKIMSNVSHFISDPGALDIEVNKIFTDKMYDDLETSMRSAGMEGLEETRAMWEKDYRLRKGIAGFIKDPIIGKKRLASMPDRVTNTINTIDGTAMRPTVINCYSGDLGTMNKWFKAWKDFMFKKKISVLKEGAESKIQAYSLLQPIKKSKYPSITEEEEKISVPLQTVCAAIFDAVLVNMMNTIASKTWQPLREDMCNKLNRQKNARTIEILGTTYKDVDVQFLQEVASSFAKSSDKSPLREKFDLYSPGTMDGERDQNSFIMLKKGKFKDVVEVTPAVLDEFKAMDLKTPAPVMNGDLLALTATDAKSGSKFLFASFHGDTNGLATIPVVTAVYNYAKSKPELKLLFGMDANTYAKVGMIARSKL